MEVNGSNGKQTEITDKTPIAIKSKEEINMNKRAQKQAYKLFFSEYPDILTVPDVCKILGASDKTVRRYLQSGELRSVKVGRSYRIPKLFLMEYMEMVY